MKYKFQFYGLNKKIKNALKMDLDLVKKGKLTIIIDSSISKKNICYYLKMPMPKLFLQFFSLDSQSPEYVKNV